MLAEWLTYLTTPCAKPYRQLGYLSELIAIKHRHRRLQAAWQPHLDACRQLITEAAAKTPRTGLVVVLGSGQLLDIPIDALAARFERVCLVDICHLRNSRKTAGTHGNIELLEADISGTVAGLLTWQAGEPLPEPQPDLSILGEADYVVSSNLLAQLPLAPLHHLEMRAPDLSDRARDGYARLIIAHHMALLHKCACPVTLISEYLQVVSDDERIIEKTDPLYGVRLPVADQDWDWALAPRPELDPNLDLNLRVAGIADLHAAVYERTCRNNTLAAP
ncbi:MAG: hypothetical protein HQ483_05250 [Rhodospirillales bacterium]|nr:hypothetical protein [Rhodospirillales bacterium]